MAFRQDTCRTKERSREGRGREQKRKDCVKTAQLLTMC